ncbi:MAG: hypothetical protein Q9216_002083 [Gyalolechia sp. 2 TL-2023]
MPSKRIPKPIQGSPGDVPASESSSAAANRAPSSSSQQAAGSAVPSIADLATALPRISSPSAQQNPRKRPAPSGVQYSASFVAERIKTLTAAREAALQAAGSTDQTSAPSDPAAAPPATGPAAAENGEPIDTKTKTPFPFTSIRNRSLKLKCAISVDHAPAMASPISWPHGFSCQLSIDPGPLGDPSISAHIRIPKEDYEGPFQGEKPNDYASITWRPGKTDAEGTYEIMSFTESSLEEFMKRDPATDKIIAPFRDEIGEDASKVRVLSLSVSGGSRSSSDASRCATAFGDERQKHLARMFSEGPTIITFFYVPPLETYSICLPAFQRCVSERLAFYHQYRDADTGEFKLNNIDDVPPIEHLGGGMYDVGRKDQYRQLEDVEGSTKDIDKFMVCCALAPIREGQFHQGRMVKLKGEIAECFVYQPPMFFGKESMVKANQLSRQQRSFNDWVLLFVRLPVKDKSEMVPEHGSRVTVTWHSEMGVFNPQKGLKGKEHNGTVVARESSDFVKTRTDFCVCLFMPKGSGPPRRRQLANLAQLERARIEVIHNLKPMERELAAVHKIWASTRAEHTSIVRTLVSSDPPEKMTTIDLSEGPDPTAPKQVLQKNKAKFRKAAAEMKKRQNEGQRRIINGLTNIENGFMAVAGPSGTGKTSTIQDTITVCLISGHKVHFTGPSNTAVDHGITSLHEGRAPAIQEKKILRLGVESVKNRILIEALKQAEARVKKESADEDMDVDNQVPEAAAIDSVMQSALDFLLAEHLNDLEQWQKYSDWVASRNAMTSTIESATESRNPERNTDVPYECTLGFHIRRLCDEDHREAVAADAKARKETKPDEHDNLPTVDKRNKSASYVKWQAYFVEHEGQLRDEDAKHYFSARREMEERVIKDVDCLGTTLNNAGSEYAAAGFAPSVICVDEAGQASFPGLFVPLAAFPHWRVLLMFGDPQQLTPTILAHSFSEVAKISKTSPLEYAYSNKRSLYLLTEQFRMAEAIYSFPNDQFYAGQLTCHAEALADNPIRQAVRRVSTKYGITGKSEEDPGSEYFFLDVVNGAARVENFGTSLLNYANADAIDELVTQLLSEGIPPSAILILSTYKAQVKHLIATLGPTADGQERYNLVLTVDSFRSRESPIVILDLVVAGDFLEYAAKEVWAAAADDNDKMQSGFQYGYVRAFSRDPHRACVALTRAMDGCIVVGQQTLLLQTMKSLKGVMFNTPSRLILDARKRHLIATDTVHLDTHPHAIKEREAMTKAQAEEKAATLSEINRLSFIQQYVNWGHQATRQDPQGDQGSIFGTKVEEGRHPDLEKVRAARKCKKKRKKQ